MEDHRPSTAYVTHWLGHPAADVARAVDGFVRRTGRVVAPLGRLELEPTVVRYASHPWAPVIGVRGRVRAGLRRWQVHLEVLPFSVNSCELGLRPRRAHPRDERWLEAAAACLRALADALSLPSAAARRAGVLPPAPARRPA